MRPVVLAGTLLGTPGSYPSLLQVSNLGGSVMGVFYVVNNYIACDVVDVSGAIPETITTVAFPPYDSTSDDAFTFSRPVSPIVVSNTDVVPVGMFLLAYYDTRTSNYVSATRAVQVSPDGSSQVGPLLSWNSADGLQYQSIAGAMINVDGSTVEIQPLAIDINLNQTVLSTVSFQPPNESGQGSAPFTYSVGYLSNQTYVYYYSDVNGYQTSGFVRSGQPDDSLGQDWNYETPDTATQLHSRGLELIAVLPSNQGIQSGGEWIGRSGYSGGGGSSTSKFAVTLVTGFGHALSWETDASLYDQNVVLTSVDGVTYVQTPGGLYATLGDTLTKVVSAFTPDPALNKYRTSSDTLPASETAQVILDGAGKFIYWFGDPDPNPSNGYNSHTRYWMRFGPIVLLPDLPGVWTAVSGNDGSSWTNNVRVATRQSGTTRRSDGKVVDDEYHVYNMSAVRTPGGLTLVGSVHYAYVHEVSDTSNDITKAPPVSGSRNSLIIANYQDLAATANEVAVHYRRERTDR